MFDQRITRLGWILTTAAVFAVILTAIYHLPDIFTRDSDRKERDDKTVQTLVQKRAENFNSFKASSYDQRGRKIADAYMNTKLLAELGYFDDISVDVIYEAVNYRATGKNSVVNDFSEISNMIEINERTMKDFREMMERFRKK